MNFTKNLRYPFLFAALFACAGSASAQGTVYGAATTTSNLAVSATVQSALKLDIKTATGGADVTGLAGSGTFSVGLGNVNGLGLGTPASNVTKTAVSGGFLYTTPVTLTPSFSGFATTTAAITVGQDATDDAASLSAAREGAAADSVAVLPAVASARVVAATALSDSTIDRYVGVFVPAGNNALALAGARSMHLVYTITIP